MVPGVNGYANYANNPYFQQAYQSPNLNAQYYQQQAQVPAQTQTLQADTVEIQNRQTQATNPNFKGDGAKKKSNKTAWTILGTAAAIGAAVLCKKAHGIGQGATWYAKVGNGLKQYGTQALTFVKNNWNKFTTWIKGKLPASFGGTP